jgi:hypothetical protein
VIYWWFVTVAWGSFWVTGIVPRTTRWLVDRLSISGWRGWHVAIAGAVLSVLGGLVAAAGLPPDLWGWAFGSALVPVLLVTGVLVSRVEVTWTAGPHGTWAPQHERSWFRPHLAAVDLDVRDVQRSTRVARLHRYGLIVVAAVAGGVFLVLGPGHLQGIEQAVMGALLTLALLELAVRKILNWRHNRITRSVNGFRPTWPQVAAIHGWQVTRPGFVPRPEWRSLVAFHTLVTPTNVTPPKPLVTLHGQVGDREIWVVAGQRHWPLVCAIELAGQHLPILHLSRARKQDGDRLVWRSADADFSDAVLGDDEVWSFLENALPAFAYLVIERDTVAMVTLPGIDPEPWRTDNMMTCLLGMVERIPTSALETHGAPPGSD